MAARKGDDNINLYSLGKIFNKLHDELIKTLAQQARDKIKNKKKNTIQTLLDFKEKSKFYYVPQEHNQPGQQPKPYGYTTPEAEKFKHEYNNKLSDILSKIKAKDLEKFIFKDDTKELYNIIQDLNASDVSTDVSYDDSQRYAQDYNREFFFNLPEFEGTPQYTFHRNLDQNKFDNIVKMITEINNYNKLIKDSTQILKRNFELAKPSLKVIYSYKKAGSVPNKSKSGDVVKHHAEREAAPYLLILANTREKLIGESEGIGKSEGATKIIQNIKQTCEELSTNKCNSQTNDTYINNLCTRINTLSANANRLSGLELKGTDFEINDIVLGHCSEVLENYITVFEIYYNFFLLDCIENSSRINPDIITTYLRDLREYMSKKTHCGKICLKCSRNMIIAPTLGVNDHVEFMRLPNGVFNEKRQKKCVNPPEDDNFKTFKVFMYYCYYKNPGKTISADKFLENHQETILPTDFLEKVKNRQTSQIFKLEDGKLNISDFIKSLLTKSDEPYLKAKVELLKTFKKNENNSDLIEKIKQNYNIMRTNYEELYKQVPPMYQMSKKLSLQHSMINFIIELNKSLKIIDRCRSEKRPEQSSRDIILKLLEIAYKIVSKEYYEDITHEEFDHTVKKLIKDINGMMKNQRKFQPKLIHSITLLKDLLSPTEYSQNQYNELDSVKYDKFLADHPNIPDLENEKDKCEELIQFDYKGLHTYVNEMYTIYKKKLAELLHGPDPKLVDPSVTSAAASSASANAFPPSEIAPIKIINGEIILTYPFEDESVKEVFAKFDSILSDRTKIDNINKLYESLTKSRLLSNTTKCWQYMLIQDVINDPEDSHRREFLCRLGAIYIVNSTQPDQKPIPLYSHDDDKCPVSSMCKVCLNTDFFRKAFNLNKNQEQQQPSSFEDYVTNFIIYNPVPYHRHDSPKCPYYNSSYPEKVSKDSHEPSSGSKPSASNYKPETTSSQTQETPYSKYGPSGTSSHWWDDNPKANKTIKAEAGPAPTNIGNAKPSTPISWADLPDPAPHLSATGKQRALGKLPNPNNNNNNNNHGGGSRTMKKNVFNKKTKTKLQKTRKHKKNKK